MPQEPGPPANVEPPTDGDRAAPEGASTWTEAAAANAHGPLTVLPMEGGKKDRPDKSSSN